MASLPGLITQRSRGTNTFPRKFKRNLGGAYAHHIFAIATATLFAIPTAAFSKSIYVGRGG